VRVTATAIQSLELKAHEEKCSMSQLELSNGPWILRTCVLLHRPTLKMNNEGDGFTSPEIASRRFLGFLDTFMDGKRNYNSNQNAIHNHIYINRRSAGMPEEDVVRDFCPFCEDCNLCPICPNCEKAGSLQL
jgi:hypothetical protein